MGKIYADSKVEIQGFAARHYDAIMNVGTAGRYGGFIKSAVERMQIEPDDVILDLGAGTGRNACLMARYLGGKGRIDGLDVSPEMRDQFVRRCRNFPNVQFQNRRIDQEFSLDMAYDKVWMSFVLHGFPHEVRSTVLGNIYRHLKPGGSFYLLDFAEFDMWNIPRLHRWVFKTVECPYAFDYIEKDWKSILSDHGFRDGEETFYMHRYVRLLKAVRS